MIGPEAGEFFARHYDVTDEGNFEGHNILNRLKHRASAASDEEQQLAALREILLNAREGRVRPGLDDKVLADWNGLMIAALVNAGVAARRAGLDRDGEARLRFHRARDDEGRPARSFLARRASCFIRASLPILPR